MVTLCFEKRRPFLAFREFGACGLGKGSSKIASVTNLVRICGDRGSCLEAEG